MSMDFGFIIIYYYFIIVYYYLPFLNIGIWRDWKIAVDVTVTFPE